MHVPVRQAPNGSVVDQEACTREVCQTPSLLKVDNIQTKYNDAAFTRYVTLMETESLVQPNRRLMFFEATEELPGHLQVPDLPEASAGYAYIYHGLWTNPRGHQVEVAVKEFKPLIPTDRQSDPAALEIRRAT
ncbi:hypothetical protein FRC01_000603, partial [Tulasnella sp. 417]